MGPDQQRSALDERKKFLVAREGWIESHVIKTVRQFGAWKEIEDLRGIAALYILSEYHAERFDPERYPRRRGETKKAHEDRVNLKLMAHAGISLLRHLQKCVLRRRRKDAAEDLPGEGVLIFNDEQRAAREFIEHVFRRCRLDDCGLSVRLRSVMGRVLEGRTVEHAIREMCPDQEEWLRVLAWSRRKSDEWQKSR